MFMISSAEVNDTTLTSTNLTETDELVWDDGTSYNAGDRVMILSTHSIYESKTSNTNVDPTTDTDEVNWFRVGATNRYKAFDRYLSDQAENADEITYQINPGSLVDIVSVYGLSAQEINLTVTSAAAIEVYNETKGGFDGSVYVDHYSYWFGQATSFTEVTFGNIPPYTDASYFITITNTGDTAKVGQIDLGVREAIGKATTGTEPTFEDFSRIERDTFGRFNIIERDYAQGATYQVAIDPYDVNRVLKLIAGRRATPTTFFVSDDNFVMGTQVYGIPEAVRFPLRFGATIYTLTVRGLT